MEFDVQMYDLILHKITLIYSRVFHLHLGMRRHMFYQHWNIATFKNSITKLLNSLSTLIYTPSVLSRFSAACKCSKSNVIANATGFFHLTHINVITATYRDCTSFTEPLVMWFGLIKIVINISFWQLSCHKAFLSSFQYSLIFLRCQIYSITSLFLIFLFGFLLHGIFKCLFSIIVLA